MSVAVLNAFSGGGGGGGGAATAPDVSPTHGQVSSVPTNSETTVVSHVVSAGFTYRLSAVIATGSADAEWIIYDNGTEVFRTRTSGAKRAVELPMPNPIPFLSGHTVSLKATHEEATSQNFYGTLLGRED